MLSLLGCAFAGCTAKSDNPFELKVIDPAMAGDCKLVGDLSGDGLPDLVVAGKPGEGLRWYRNPDWKGTKIADPANEFTTDAALGDMDADGDLDIVVPDGRDGCNLFVFENPGPAALASGANWPAHCIASVGSWVKDVEIADFDGDGHNDIALRTRHRSAIYFYQGGQWLETRLTGDSIGPEGMTSGDVDGDGLVDLVFRDNWYRNPGGAKARQAVAWQAQAVGHGEGAYKAVVADLNGDGRRDLLYSSCEGPGPLMWYEQRRSGGWRPHTIIDDLERAHTLQAGDMDGDGDIDIVAGQMHTSREKKLYVLYNELPARWRVTPIGSGGLHNGVVADVDRDGDLDVFGANWTGNPPVRLWLNHSPAAPPGWRTAFVSMSHERTFGLGFGDVDGDGNGDIVSGSVVFLRRGQPGELLWEQVRLPDRLQAFAVLADGPGTPGRVIAQRQDQALGIYALRLDPATLRFSPAEHIADVPAASHSEGSQGYLLADLDRDGHPEIALTSGGGLYMFREHAGQWQRTQVSPDTSDEGLAAADINADGWPDLVATTGEQRQLMWYANPAGRTGAWTAHQVAELTGFIYPDRVAAADLDGDGRVDIAVSEENGLAGDARVLWFQQLRDGWQQHLLTIQGSTNSMAIADMNQDGAADIITAEHRGEHRSILWLNDGHGRFSPLQLASGLEAHLGALPADVDGDGDLDLVNIAWDDYSKLWLLLNTGQRR